MAISEKPEDHDYYLVIAQHNGEWIAGIMERECAFCFAGKLPPKCKECFEFMNQAERD